MLLQEAQNIQTLALAPWLLIPGLVVIVAVLAFNFVGDGLRDAADPVQQLSAAMTEPLLSVRDLKVSFALDEGLVRAVDGTSFDVMPGQVLGVVGESGCGKSVTMRAILQLVDRPGRITRARSASAGGDSGEHDRSRAACRRAAPRCATSAAPRSR